MKAKLEHAIVQWDRRSRTNSPYALANALLRLDDVWREHEAGKSLARALYDGFNDRLLSALEKTADLPLTYGGGAQDRGRPA